MDSQGRRRAAAAGSSCTPPARPAGRLRGGRSPQHHGHTRTTGPSQHRKRHVLACSAGGARNITAVASGAGIRQQQEARSRERVKSPAPHTGRRRRPDGHAEQLEQQGRCRHSALVPAVWVRGAAPQLRSPAPALKPAGPLGSSLQADLTENSLGRSCHHGAGSSIAGIMQHRRGRTALLSTLDSHRARRCSPKLAACAVAIGHIHIYNI